MEDFKFDVFLQFCFFRDLLILYKHIYILISVVNYIEVHCKTNNYTCM